MGIVVVGIVLLSCRRVFDILWVEFDVGEYLLRGVDVCVVDLSRVGDEC